MTLLNINLDHLPIIWVGFVASLVSGLATGLGAIPVFFLRTLSAKVQDILLGFSAGIMLSATFFSLILPGLEYAKETVSGNLQAAVIVSGGILLGAVVLWIAHRFAPHEHFVTGKEGLDVAGLRRVWLFVIAITLHNVPEGLSVGVGFSGGDIGNGIALMIGIGVQNIPEGLAVAAALAALGYSKSQSFLIALGTGLVEPVGGVIGVSAVSLVHMLQPWGLSFAAGAMLFVISDEIIPETHRSGYADQATFALLTGFVIMMMFDFAVG